MSGHDHGGQPHPAEAAHGGQPHLRDPEAHVRAVEEDLEYYRTKRLEPRVFNMARRGLVTLDEILDAHVGLVAASAVPSAPAAGLEARVRAVEDALDEYVRGVGLLTPELVRGLGPIEEMRRERGDYDEFFRIAKKPHRGTLEERLAALERDLTQYRKVLDAVLAAVRAKGLLDEAELERRRAAAARPGPWNGARIVARAWVDPEFKARLMARGREAVRELDIPPGRLGRLGVVENTERVHNVVVCTLCSCYPYDLLGDTPWWYKHETYRQRIVAEPRRTLAEMFGLRLPATVEIRVWDSTSDVRYMVLPRRPAGTETLSEEALARLVTPESLIGTGEALDPAALGTRRPEEVRRVYL